MCEIKWIKMQGETVKFNGFEFISTICARNSNPDLQKSSDALSLDSTTLPWPLNLERGRRVGGWTHHEVTYHLLRERGILYGLCRLLPNEPDAAHLLISPVIYQGEISTFSSLLATENISHSKGFTKKSINHTRKRPSKHDPEPLWLTGFRCNALFTRHFKA